MLPHQLHYYQPQHHHPIVQAYVINMREMAVVLERATKSITRKVAPISINHLTDHKGPINRSDGDKKATAKAMVNGKAKAVVEAKDGLDLTKEAARIAEQLDEEGLE